MVGTEKGQGKGIANYFDCLRGIAATSWWLARVMCPAAKSSRFYKPVKCLVVTVQCPVDAWVSSGDVSSSSHRRCG